MSGKIALFKSGTVLGKLINATMVKDEGKPRFVFEATITSAGTLEEGEAPTVRRDFGLEDQEELLDFVNETGWNGEVNDGAKFKYPDVQANCEYVPASANPRGGKYPAKNQITAMRPVIKASALASILGSFKGLGAALAKNNAPEKAEKPEKGADKGEKAEK